MRDFEVEVKKIKDWENICLAKPVPGDIDGKVACEPKSFQTPLNLFQDKSALDTMSEEEITEVL